MEILKYSRNRIYETFTKWEVPRDFADPMANYLVYGYKPGSCFTAVLANDFLRAINSSHSSNTIVAFKSLVGWIQNVMPVESFGSYEIVDQWIKLSEQDRRTCLEKHNLIYTSKEEMILALKNEHIVEPILW